MSGLRAGLLAAAAAAALAPGASALAPATVPAAVTVDGPSPSIASVGGIALAQDGSGAIVYLKLIAGTPHVFVALEHAGVWAPAVQVDAAGAGAATGPAVAVADGGRLAVTWISAGTLYAAVHAVGAAGFTAPQAIAPASGTAALGMSVSGTAYVAYLDGAGSSVDVARLDRASTAFAVVSGSMTDAPITPAGGPVITVAADATAVVAWVARMADASTHVFVRRVSAAGPSPVLDDATVASLGGAVGGSADSPTLGVAYDASDAWIAFRETLGGISRVIVDELLGDELRPPALVDSLGATPGSASALAPALALNGNGQGLTASELAPSDDLALSELGTGPTPGQWTAGAVANAAPDTAAPAPIAAVSDTGRGVVAYAPSPGALDALIVKVGSTAVHTSGPFPIASAVIGPVAAAADASGDVLVAFVAGPSAAPSLMVEPLVLAPTAPRAIGSQAWLADAHEVLRWQPSRDAWAPATYSVYIDGTRVGTTTATSFAATVADGRHTFQIVAADAYGQTAASQQRALLVDAAPPVVRLHIGGRHRAQTRLLFAVSASSLSGIRSVAVDYGDGHTSAAPSSTHAYAHSGRYEVSVVVTDRAGVSATLREHVDDRVSTVILHAGGCTYELADGQPWLMGIVNATPDSFSDAGRHPSLEARVALARELASAGARVIDIGGESGVTNRPAVDAAEEIERVVPLIERVSVELDVLVSVDTYKPAVARAAIAAGAVIVNDVSGLRDPELADVCAASGAALVVMHTAAPPKQRRQDPDLYADVLEEVMAFLGERVALARSRGVAEEQLIVDPGPDFAKTPAQTVALLRGAHRLGDLGRPVLMALSRKDFVGALTARTPRERGAGTLAALAHALDAGAHIFRVHDVAAAADFVTVRAALRGELDVARDLALPDALRWEAPPDELQ